MKVKLLFIFLISLSHFCKGQSIQSFLVSNTGVVKTNGNLRAAWSVGEIAVQNYSGGQVQLSEGFHQVSVVPTSIFSYKLDIDINIYPNPSINMVYVEFEKDKSIDLEIYNIMGSKVMKIMDIETSRTINIGDLPLGTYLFKFKNREGKFDMHKFIKI